MKLVTKVLGIVLIMCLINLTLISTTSSDRKKKNLKSALTDGKDGEKGDDPKTDTPPVDGNPQNGASPNVSAAELAAAGKTGKDVPGYESSSVSPTGGTVPVKELGIEVPKGYELKAKPPKEVDPEEETNWKSLFGMDRSERCAGGKILRYELQKLGIGPNGELLASSRGGKGPFGWLKQWGFGNTAYLFDFLDPALRPLILVDFEEIWKKFKSYPSDDNALYKDPYKVRSVVNPKLDPVSQKRQQESIEKFKKTSETEIFKNSVNAVQLNLGIKELNWHHDKSSPDNAKSFIKSYDINLDGRLSPRELILGSIFHNKAILGTDDCTLCYESLVDKIDAIFAYIDCDQDGLISSEDIYNHLPKLKRETEKWNYFTLAPKANIRTAVSNDFILKNMYSVNGMLSKPEFRLGVLLGFWDRQTDNNEIVKDEKINMKRLRWGDDDTVDIAALNYIKQKAEIKAELKKKDELARGNRNTKIEISMAKEPTGR